MKKTFLMISVAFVLPVFPYSEEKAAEDLKIFEQQVFELKALYEQNEKEYNEWVKERKSAVLQLRQKLHELEQEHQQGLKEREAYQAQVKFFDNALYWTTVTLVVSGVFILLNPGAVTALPAGVGHFGVIPVAAVLAVRVIDETKLAAPAA